MMVMTTERMMITDNGKDGSGRTDRAGTNKSSVALRDERMRNKRKITDGPESTGENCPEPEARAKLIREGRTHKSNRERASISPFSVAVISITAAEDTVQQIEREAQICSS